MNRSTTIVGVLPLIALGCRSVEVPRERYYRLDPPAVAVDDPQRGGVLRVCDLQLGRALDGDNVLVADGVRLEPRPLARWVAPLDRLVTDALVLGVSRARVCSLVKGAADAGVEDWTLHGRIVEFSEVHDPAQSVAKVVLELWLEDQNGRLLFHDEFAAREPLGSPDGDADAAVAALSRGLQSVVSGVVQRMRSDGLFAAAAPFPRPSR